MSRHIQFQNVSASTIYLTEFSQQQMLTNEIIDISRIVVEDRSGMELDDFINAGSIVLIDDNSVNCTPAEAIKVMNGFPDLIAKAGIDHQVLQTDDNGSIIWKEADHNKLQHIYTSVPQVTANVKIPGTTAMPLITDGVPLVSIIVTPVSADSVFYLRLKTTFQPTGNDLTAAAVLYRDGIALQVFTTGRGKDKQISPLDIDYLDIRPSGIADVLYEIRVGLLYGSGMAYYNFDGETGSFADQWLKRKFEVIEYAASVIVEVV